MILDKRVLVRLDGVNYLVTFVELIGEHKAHVIFDNGSDLIIEREWIITETEED